MLYADAELIVDAALAALRERPASEHPFASMVTVLSQLGEAFTMDREQINARTAIAAAHPSVADYERRVLEGQTADVAARFVAERLGVEVATDPRPRVWAVLAMSAFRVALHVWLEGGQQGPLSAEVRRALEAAAEATAALPPRSAQVQG